jgi:hypothetical protein
LAFEIARETGDVHQSDNSLINITAVAVLANTIFVTLKTSPISSKTCAESTQLSIQNRVPAIKDGMNNSGINIAVRPESDFEMLSMRQMTWCRYHNLARH